MRWPKHDSIEARQLVASSADAFVEQLVEEKEYQETPWAKMHATIWERRPYHNHSSSIELYVSYNHIHIYTNMSLVLIHKIPMAFAAESRWIFLAANLMPLNGERSMLPTRVIRGLSCYSCVLHFNSTGFHLTTYRAKIHNMYWHKLTLSL